PIASEGDTAMLAMPPVGTFSVDAASKTFAPLRMATSPAAAVTDAPAPVSPRVIFVAELTPSVLVVVKFVRPTPMPASVKSAFAAELASVMLIVKPERPAMSLLVAKRVVPSALKFKMLLTALGTPPPVQLPGLLQLASTAPVQVSAVAGVARSSRA